MDKSLTIISSFDDAQKAARAMALSGFFPDSKTEAQAIVKVLAGHELGFGPFASMSGISIIQGRPAIGANLIGAAIKSNARYDYRIVELTDAVCEIAFFDKGKEVGRSRFTMDDARKAQLAGKDNWTKYPKNMLFARAISNGARWYCPDVFNGAPVYTPDELGAEVNEEGNVIEVKVVEQPQPPHGTTDRAAPQQEYQVPVMDYETAKGEANHQGVLYISMTDSVLEGKVIPALIKSLTENHLEPTDKEEKERKLAAARAIMAKRREMDNS